MLQTLMVFPSNSGNDLFNVAHSQLELFQQEENQQNGMMASASSPIIHNSLESSTSFSSSSSYINPSQQPHPPTLHQPHPPQHPPQYPSPQQPPRPRPHPQSSTTYPHPHPHPHPHPQQPSQVALSPPQQNMHYPLVSQMLVSNLSAPSSPPHMIKTEEHFHQPNIDYLVYPPFDMHSPPTPQQPHHILPSQRPHHGLPSPQQRMMSYGQSQLRIHQHQSYHSSSQHHQQIMYDPSVAPTTPGGRPSISSALSMSMPLSVSIPAVTSGPSGFMMNSPTSANSATSHHLFTPTSASNSIPFFHTSPTSAASTPGLTRDEMPSPHKLTTAAMMTTFQPKRPQGHPSIAASETGFVNPVSPKRSRPDPGYHQQHHHPLSLESATALASEFQGALSSGSPHNTIATAVAVVSGNTTTTTAAAAGTKRSRRSSAASTSRTCTTELYGLEEDIETRMNKVARTSASASAAAAASSVMSTGRPSTATMAAEASGGMSRRTGKALVDNVSQTRSQTMAQPLSPPLQSTEPTVAVIDYTPQTSVIDMTPHRVVTPSTTKPRAGNVTHPRRAAQNRAAQRTFRNRRKAYIKDMEQKVLELHQIRARFEMLQSENREIWKRYRILENLVASSSSGGSGNNNRQLVMPSFTPMTPFCETEAGLAAQAAQAAHAAQAAQAQAGVATAATGGRGGMSDFQYHSQSSEVDDEDENEAAVAMGHSSPSSASHHYQPQQQPQQPQQQQQR
ncbi:MAG: hypothetical protein J3Q66DRAFT_182679 [Benniella sp.]|nr:MAG: hypothetical protein J3Q66DRAFT_182679 [Benniella sp.]